MTDTNILRDQLLIISDAFPLLNLARRIATVRREIGGRIVFTTSFGIEDQAIADAIFTLATGRFFSGTYELWAETELVTDDASSPYTPIASARTINRAPGRERFRASVEARSSQE